MSSGPDFQFDPFLLPTCDVCGAAVNLSHVEPAMDQLPAKRVYRCPRCNAEKILPSGDRSGAD
jgi:DNA-directed RNA polymerase subunit RPC12/RpoP